MTHNSAHQQHIEWLKAQLNQQKQELTAAEKQLDEVKALVEQKRESVSYFQKKLEELASDGVEEVDLEEEELEGEKFYDEELNEEESKEGNKRKPKDMMRNEFQEMTLGDAAKKILDQYRQPLKTENVAAIIFEPKSQDERQRAENSLAAELRRGAKDGRWQKIDKGFFVSNLANMQTQTFPFRFQQPSTFETINNGNNLDS